MTELINARLDAVYERFTRGLAKKLAAYSPGAALSISQAFRQLQDPETGCRLSLLRPSPFKLTKDIDIAKERFELAIKQTLPAQFLTDPVGLSTLFDILTWHAVFPFPVPPTPATSNSLPISEDGFLRAICLLTRDPPPRYAPQFSEPAIHGMLTGTYGGPNGDYGWLLINRGKDGRDFRRRLFRCLAEPVQEDTAHGDTTPTTIPIPRFITNLPPQDDTPVSDTQDNGGDGGNDNDDEEATQQLVITANETERTIDLQDVLSEYPPETDPLSANPLRESYAPVANSLPHFTHDLKELSVPREKLRSLVRVLVPLAEPVPSGEAGLGGLVAARLNHDDGGEEGCVTWEEFDVLVEGASVSTRPLNHE